MKKVLCILDSSGDTRIEFDESEATVVERARAEAEFERLMAKPGMRAFKVRRANGEPDEPVRKFAELENETVLFGPLVGG